MLRGNPNMILQNWWVTTLMGEERPMAAPLAEDIEAEVLVVGGGAAGLAAAHRLMEDGRDVVLLERNICGGSSTGKSAGFLTPDSELELSQLIRRFGPDGARDLWQVPVRGIELMLQRIEEHAIDCDLVKQDSLFLGNGSSGLADVRSEARARASLGWDHELYEADALQGILGTDAYSGGVRYGGTYGVDALRYAQGMKMALLEGGVRVYEASEARHLEDHTVRTTLGSVTADEIIFCADKLQRSLTRHADQVYHALTFLSISEPLPQEVIASLFPSGERFQCWDSDLVYTYYRLTGDERLLVGGGSMVTTYAKEDVTSPRVIRGVQEALRRKLPQIQDLEFLQYWPGRIDSTRDLLPTVLRDTSMPWVHFVLGCVGLPWATFCGDLVARHVHDPEGEADGHYYRYFRPDRSFLVPLWLEGALGKRVVFSLNNAYAKYYQVDRGVGA